jgi:hypothetical protein
LRLTLGLDKSPVWFTDAALLHGFGLAGAVELITVR